MINLKRLSLIGLMLAWCLYAQAQQISKEELCFSHPNGRVNATPTADRKFPTLFSIAMKLVTLKRRGPYFETKTTNTNMTTAG
jgi:hypothetical protein